jgi:hypothetical protein
MGYNEGTYLRSSVVVVTESKTREGWERYCCSLQMIKLLSQRERERERERETLRKATVKTQINERTERKKNMKT